MKRLPVSVVVCERTLGEGINGLRASRSAVVAFATKFAMGGADRFRMTQVHPVAQSAAVACVQRPLETVQLTTIDAGIPRRTAYPVRLDAWANCDALPKEGSRL